MATQAAYHRGSDVRQSPSTSSAYGPVPGSPTLTNPDMILPDYDYPDEHSDLPLSSWDNIRSTEMEFPASAFIAGPVLPSTPIIYGNGTMLSDIGEVTEVESVVGGPRRVPSHMSNHSDHIPLRSSPTMGGTRIKRRSQVLSHGRRASIESTSTVTTMDHNGHFADFDDVGSVEDVNFQGDDEESMASEYVEGTPAHEPETRSGMRPVNEDRFSTNSLSEKAEQILANAKQRLTTMEGNLSRARSSLYYSTVSDGSTPSPPAIRPATSALATFSGHTRISSEIGTSIPTGFPQRSASALGAAGGYRQPLTSSRSADALGGAYAGGGHKLSHHPLDRTLEPLSEDDGQSDADSRRNSSGLRGPTFDPFIEKELTRSASVAQVRDLKDQMKDLKGKISSLKEQARVDSMKRRSLQSLRTPSPFTHARWDQGVIEPRKVNGAQNESNQKDPAWNADTPGDVAAEDEEPLTYEVKPPAQRDEEVGVAGFKEAPKTNFQDEMKIGTNHSQQKQKQEDRRPVYGAGDLDTEEGYLEEETDEDEVYQDAQYEEDQQQGVDDEDYVSESGDSTYHDTFQHPVSHEDREDAFDYEHFFLHSAMGSMSQQRYGRRGSIDSISSEESVETTKGPFASRERRPSMDTMSSVDTFATATEGRGSRTSIFKDKIRETVVSSSGEESDLVPTPKRSTFDGGYSSTNSSGYFQPNHYGTNPSYHRSTSSTSAVPSHRPSVSSFVSTGTTRSFPLVNKAKLNGGVLTPGGSPDQELKQISRSLMNGTTGAYDKDEDKSSSRSSPTMQLLSKDDQILIERLVGSLGKCVLGLSEASRASSEARAYRRRIERARKILEGLED